MDVTPAEASEEPKGEPGEPKAEQGPAPSTADAAVEVIDVDEVELDVKPPPPGAPALRSNP